MILATSNVEFEDGETVFDVLNRVCEYAESSWNIPGHRCTVAIM